jgi:hypothetical protein
MKIEMLGYRNAWIWSIDWKKLSEKEGRKLL